jgi:hypothetical protein
MIFTPYQLRLESLITYNSINSMVKNDLESSPLKVNLTIIQSVKCQIKWHCSHLQCQKITGNIQGGPQTAYREDPLRYAHFQQ